MKTIIGLCFAFAAFGLPASASASCTNLPELLHKAYPDAVKTEAWLEIDGDYRQAIDPAAVACKIWPANQQLTLLAVPRLEARPAADDEIRGDIEILVADTESGDIVARRLEKGAAFSDAIAFDSVGLDTARYDIRDGQRAFGFRARYSHNSSAFPFNETVLWLVALDKAAISPVLEGFRVEIGRGENDQNCTGFFETTTSAITMGEPGAGGYRALVIDRTISLETSKPGGEDCSSTTEITARKQYILHYGDPHYGAFDRKGTFKDETYNDLFSSLLSDK